MGGLALVLGIAALSSFPVLRRVGFPITLGLVSCVVVWWQWLDPGGIRGRSGPFASLGLAQYGLFVSTVGVGLVLGGALLVQFGRRQAQPAPSPSTA